MQMNNVDDLPSDHLEIMLTLSNTILHIKAALELTNKSIDWEAFYEGVNND